MKNMLFLTPELPYPPQSGGKLKSLRLLDAMAERYKVTLASPLKVDDAKHITAFGKRSPCVAHLHRRVNIPRSAANLVKSYLGGVPLNVYRTYDPVMAAEVRRLAIDKDVILVDHYEVAAYVPSNFKGTVIYHAHNAYHQMWERFARLPGNPLLRIAAHLEAARVRRIETAIARRANLVFAAPNDAELLIRSGIDAEKIEHTYHLGDDTQLELPPLRFGASKRRIMYVGFLGWEANTLGLLWFLENVWPKLIEVLPDLEFDIVGKDPDERLQTLAAIYPGIHLHGFVEDLQSIYDGARVSVAPLLFGSGMKVKVLDAMARGMPTVTTPVGAEGIDCKSGQELLIADDAQAMADGVLELLNNELLWKQLSTSSRDLIARKYTWRTLFYHMHEAIDVALRRDTRPRAAEILPTPVLQHG